MLQRLLHRHPQATRQDRWLHLRPVLGDQREAREEDRRGLERHDRRGESLFMCVRGCLRFCLSAYVRNVLSASSAGLRANRVRARGGCTSTYICSFSRQGAEDFSAISMSHTVTEEVWAISQLLAIRNLPFVTHTDRRVKNKKNMQIP